MFHFTQQTTKRQHIIDISRGCLDITVTRALDDDKKYPTPCIPPIPPPHHLSGRICSRQVVCTVEQNIYPNFETITRKIDGELAVLNPHI